MYQLYIKTPSSFDGKKLLGEFKEIDDANERIQKNNVPYMIFTSNI